MCKKLWNKDFILMLQGSTVSMIGDILYSVAIGYWVYEETGSTALMGIMSSISLFISMFLMPFSGSIIDKCDRKWIIVGTDVARGAVMLVVGSIALTGNLSVPLVLAAAFLASLCSVFFNPAVNTLFIDIIPKEEMVRGQSISAGISTTVSLIDEAVSGALVAFFGVPWIILLNGISYLISAGTELFIIVPRTVQQGQKVTVKGLLEDMGTGIQSILENDGLRVFVLGALTVNLLGAGPERLMLAFVLGKGFSVDLYGFLMSAQTAASLICVFLLGIIRLKPKAKYRAMTIGFLGGCIFSIGAYLSRDFLWLCILSFLGTFLNTLGNSIFSASMMLAMPEKNRGSILGLVSSASLCGVALSTLIFGFLGERYPLALVFVAGTLLTLVPMAWMCLHKAAKKFILSH